MKKKIMSVTVIACMMTMASAFVADTACHADWRNDGSTRVIVSRRDKNGREIGVDYRPTNRKGDRIGIWTRF